MRKLPLPCALEYYEVSNFMPIILKLPNSYNINRLSNFNRNVSLVVHYQNDKNTFIKMLKLKIL